MIYVVGCNHGIQPRDPDWLGGDTEKMAEQKARFGELIESTTNQGEVEFVAEEWGLSTLLQGLVQQGLKLPKIQWIET